MLAPKLRAEKKKAGHAPVQALPGVSQTQATVGNRTDKPPRRQLTSGVRNQMNLDLDHIVAKLRQSWLSDKEDLEILEIVRKYWKDDQAAKASGEKFEWGYLDAIVQQLKGRSFSGRTFSSVGVQQYQMVYDALWYTLDEPALSDFKQLMMQSREAPPPDAKPENVWSTVGKQEAVGGWGILKGMGTTLAGVASPVAAEKLAKYFDESGDILLGKEWSEGEALYKWGGISLNARQIGTAGGGVIMQLALLGKSKSKDTSDAFKKAQHVLGIISNIQGAAQAANQIADVVAQRRKIGNLSAGNLIRDPEFLGPMTAFIASVHGLVTGSSASGDKAKHDRIQLLIQSAQFLPEIERIIEIQNSNKAPEVKHLETGEIVVGIIGQVVGLMISGKEYRQTRSQGTMPPKKDVGKSTAEKIPPLPRDEAAPPQVTVKTEKPSSGKQIAEDNQLSALKKIIPLTPEASSPEQIANYKKMKLAKARVSAKPGLGAPQGSEAVALVESPVATPETARAQLTATGQPMVVIEPSINLRAAGTVDQNAKQRVTVIPVPIELGRDPYTGVDLRFSYLKRVVKPAPATKPRAPVEPTTIPPNTTEPASPQLNSAAELSVPMPRETPQVIVEAPKDFDSMNSLSAEQQIGFRVFKPEVSSDATPIPQSTKVRKPLRASSSVTLKDVPPADVLDFLAKQNETPPESTRLQIQLEIPQADQRSPPSAELGMSLSSRERDSTNPGPDIESPAPKVRTDIPSVNEFLLPPQPPARKSIGPKKPDTDLLGSDPNLLNGGPTFELKPTSTERLTAVRVQGDAKTKGRFIVGPELPAGKDPFEVDRAAYVKSASKGFKSASKDKAFIVVPESQARAMGFVEKAKTFKNPAEEQAFKSRSQEPAPVAPVFTPAQKGGKTLESSKADTGSHPIAARTSPKRSEDKSKAAWDRTIAPSLQENESYKFQLAKQDELGLKRAGNASEKGADHVTVDVLSKPPKIYLNDATTPNQIKKKKPSHKAWYAQFKKDFPPDAKGVRDFGFDSPEINAKINEAFDAGDVYTRTLRPGKVIDVDGAPMREYRADAPVKVGRKTPAKN